MMAWVVLLLGCAVVLALMIWATEREAEEEERFEEELADTLESLNRYSHLQQRALDTANRHQVKLTRVK